MQRRDRNWQCDLGFKLIMCIRWPSDRVFRSDPQIHTLQIKSRVPAPLFGSSGDTEQQRRIIIAALCCQGLGHCQPGTRCRQTELSCSSMCLQRKEVRRRPKAQKACSCEASPSCPAACAQRQQLHSSCSQQKAELGWIRRNRGARVVGEPGWSEIG